VTRTAEEWEQVRVGLKQEHDWPTPERAIRTMHLRWGTTPGAVCRDCTHFLRKREATKVYFKCEKYGVTSGAATDWRARWNACGLWERA